VLANFVLSHHGLGTRLVHVRVAGRVAHAVCYVTENNAYLDYNNRKFFVTLERSKPDLRAIANTVADSLSASWTTASEFTHPYETRRKTMTATISRTGGD
jgi:formyltetrahydrofolate hydrolase